LRRGGVDGAASELTLSVYDAAYLELALRLKIPLAC
jgi:predicted nucleic acid-binding protein